METRCQSGDLDNLCIESDSKIPYGLKRMGENVPAGLVFSRDAPSALLGKQS
jgi:hypothetical protein